MYAQPGGDHQGATGVAHGYDGAQALVTWRADAAARGIQVDQAAVELVAAASDG